MKSYLVAVFVALGAWALGLQPTAAQASHHSKYRAEISALPQLKREALVLLVAQQVEANSANLEMDTPAERADALKVLAWEQLQLGWVAGDADWSEMQKLHQDGAETFARMIRGELKGAAATSAIDALERRQRKIIALVAGRVDAAGISPKDPMLQSLAKKIEIDVVAKSKIYAWGDHR